MRKLSAGVGWLGLILMVINFAGALTWPVVDVGAIVVLILTVIGLLQIVPAIGLFWRSARPLFLWTLWINASAFILWLGTLFVPDLLKLWFGR
jgi:hypothetical protein